MTACNIFKNPIWTKQKTLFYLWIIIAIIAGILKWDSNNFKIFEGVYFHTINETSLYAEYPAEYFDTNYYGPLFSIIVAPFAILPKYINIILWEVAMTVLLFLSINRLSIDDKKRVFILWFCSHELYTALCMAQFNIVIAAIIIGTWISFEKEKDWLAAILIVIGTFVKLYGIVGLAFFFFSKHKLKFILYFLAAAIIGFVLPMAISSPEYIIAQYHEWSSSLFEKNQSNLDSYYQNISVLGFVLHIWKAISPSTVHLYSETSLVISGAILFCLPYIRINQWASESFRYAYLASTLLFVVLFSSGSESSGYIIALTGVGIWYWTAPWKRGKWAIALMIFCFILTSLSPSDLFPKFIRENYILPYSLKAFPCIIVWIWLIYEMLTKNYNTKTLNK